jgi:hypothetical protein
MGIGGDGRGPTGACVVVCVGVLAFGAGEAGAVTLTAACSGTTGDVGSDSGSLVSEINEANAAGGANTVQLGAGCAYTLTAVDNYWYGPNGLPGIASTITIQGNGATIARSTAVGIPPFRLFFVGADSLISDWVSPGGRESDAGGPDAFGRAGPGRRWR